MNGPKLPRIKEVFNNHFGQSANLMSNQSSASIHFIAIGGSAMHNLAIALSRKGYRVTGSDDEIFEPSLSRLEKQGILPGTIGWNPDRITSNLEAVILGMHARPDNPELARARELGLKIYSYPEYVYEQTKHKTRVVIGGSHGKTTITSMILHVLNRTGREHDYLVGAQLQGYDCMVRLSESAPIAIIEGDEYLSSPIDRRPKFHLYMPDVAVISGIAWDHINVFPTFDNYVDQFRQFINLISPGGSLIYFEGDPVLRDLAEKADPSIKRIPYGTPASVNHEGITSIIHRGREFPLRIFGEHNLQNLMAALRVCLHLGLTEEEFLKAISDFTGAGKRLERVMETPEAIVFKDFAHAPSKLKATTAAVKSQFPQRKLIACMELHTFSSLNEAFLDEYRGSMAGADEALVYFSPEVVRHKKLAPISPERVAAAFGTSNVSVYTDSSEMMRELLAMRSGGGNLLLMSSGNFDGLDFREVANQWLSPQR
jgi:UDP-N-acetylmuramate: L-alanyl-gamma-D-glutamyl-meso-diaminopimelate ligase